MIRWALHMAKALKKSQNCEFCLSERSDNKESVNLKQVMVLCRYLGSWNKGAAPNKEPWGPCSQGVLADMVKGHLQCSDRFSTSTAQHMGAHIDPSTFHLLFQKNALPTPSSPHDWMKFLSSWSCLKSLKGSFGVAQEKVLSPWTPCLFQGEVLGITTTVPSEAQGLVHQLDQGTMLRYLLYKVIIKFTNTSLNIDQPS